MSAYLIMAYATKKLPIFYKQYIMTRLNSPVSLNSGTDTTEKSIIR